MKLADRLLPKVNPLFFRILLYFWSLLIPILIIGGIIYYNMVDRAERDAMKQIELNLASSADTVDVYLNIVQQASTSFFYDANVKTLIAPFDQYEPEDGLRIPQIPAVLAQIANNISEIVDNVFVYVDAQKVYTPGGMENYDYFFEHLYAFEAYDKSFWDGRLQSGASLEMLAPSVVHVVPFVRKDTLPIVFRKALNGNEAVLVATVSLGMLHHTIVGNSIFPATEYVVLNKSDEMLLNTAGDALEPEHIAKLRSELESGKGSGKLQLGEREVMVNYTVSPNYGWTYMAFTPLSEFDSISRPIVVLIGTICLALLFIGIVFSFIFTFNLYNPIRRIIDILGQRDDSFDAEALRRPDQLELIGKGIHQLIEHGDRFKSRSESLSLDYLDRALLGKLLGRPAASAEQVEEMLREYRRFKQPYYVCCAVMFRFTPSFYADVQDVDRLRILANLKAIIFGFFSPLVPVHIVEEQEYLHLCIVNVGGEDELELVRRAVDRLLDGFRHDADYCGIHVGIGSMQAGMRGLAKSCDQAMNALAVADKTHNFEVVDSAEGQDKNAHYTYTFNDENTISNCLQAGDAANLRSKVDEIVGRNEKQGAPPSGLSLLIADMYNTGRRYLLETGHTPAQLSGDDDYGQLADKAPQYFDYQNRKQLLLEYFEAIIELTGKLKLGGQKSDVLVASIVEYIHDNYEHDLFLENIAERMGCSAKYLSRVFKEHTGLNLAGYISLFRINKAKELLEQTDWNVQEIAGKVGIYSRTTFIRLFKKYEGITPNAYRDLKRKSGS